MAREVATKGIDGIGELVIMAPIKPGVIDAYENITYESRLRFVAEAFFRIEGNSREHELYTPFADVAERILTVFNFRIGVLDKNLAAVTSKLAEDGTSSLDVKPQRYMFLIATYDGPFEPYLRLIWDPLGPFLDLLLCNCEGYKLATETGFPEYIDWVRDHLVESSIFYSTTSNTLRDQLYLSDLEKMQRELDPTDANCDVDGRLAALTGHSAEEKALNVWKDADKQTTAVRLAFEALTVLYRLADYFRPDHPKDEGKILIRAAQDLLKGLPERLGEILAAPPSPAQKMLHDFGVSGAKLGPYTEHWAWFTTNVRKPVQPIEVEPARSEVQRGLLTGYDDDGFKTTHGVTLLYSISDAQAAGRTILLDLPNSWEGDDVFEGVWGDQPIRFYGNVSFTAPGLRAMALDPVDFKRFPKEFRDGLFKRAPSIGDKHKNHPRRWKFPYRFDPTTFRDDPQRPTIHSEEIDVVVQLRISTKFDNKNLESVSRDLDEQARALRQLLEQKVYQDLFAKFCDSARKGLNQVLSAPMFNPGIQLANADDSEPQAALPVDLEAFNPLAWLTLALMLRNEDEGTKDSPGLRLLAIESTFRPLDGYDDPLPDVQPTNRDHFGFIDGISQPEPALIGNAPPAREYDNRVPYGDILCGYHNSRNDSAADQNFNGSEPLLKNGSFLVLRKIAMFPDRLEQLGGAECELAQAMVGRTADGVPLLPAHGELCNDFTYQNDPEQAHCPFSAHIRLANPRDRFQGRPAPRILRRGMSYGDRYIPRNEASKQQQRGILFMAYGASLSEQYEVIQRWLNGGNPTGVSSAANDPLTGARQEVGPYTFRYRTKAGVQRAKTAEPLTELQWGLYAFTPSRSALSLICGPKKAPILLGEQNLGEATIKRILALPPERQRPEWKRLLEDFFVKDLADLGQTPPVWRAIRDLHGGVLRIECGLPYGNGDVTHKVPIADDKGPVVLVADGDLIREVLSNSADFSLSERLTRTVGSTGEHYVSMDPDPSDTSTNLVSDYAQQSFLTNRVLFGVSNDTQRQQAVFDAVYTIATMRLIKAKDFSMSLSKNGFYKIDLRRDFLNVVLGQVCAALFDIPNTSPLTPTDGHIDLGPWGWQPIDLDGDTTAAPGMRKPRCPADFMAPSRFSSYPRPSPAIQNYGVSHGEGLRAVSRKLIGVLRDRERAQAGSGFKGVISAQLAKLIQDDDLLTRNIIGSMTGAIPPLDANLRGIFFNWIDGDALWRTQTDYMKGKSGSKPTLAETERAIGKVVKIAMCKRPAPDLLYRTATRHTTIGGIEVNPGETVILALISPMLASLDTEKPEIKHVFGGIRQAAWQPEGEPVHACPAYGLSMAIIYGIVAALFDAGRIVVQPASLILQITDWDGPPGMPEGSSQSAETVTFTPFG